MGAFNFKKRFAGKVQRGEKRTTIRLKLKDGRDPVVGERMALYYGQRTKQCRKLLDAVITKRQPIIIYKSGSVIRDGRALTFRQIVSLATRDGFNSVREFWAFFFQGGDFEGFCYTFKKVR